MTGQIPLEGSFDFLDLPLNFAMDVVTTNRAWFELHPVLSMELVLDVREAQKHVLTALQ